MTRIALATAQHLPQLSEDDNILYRAMLAHGHDAAPVIWDSDADWRSYDAIVIRSVWDYHLKHARFLEWLDQLDASGARVYNPTSLLRWNSDKHYMLDLAERGVHVTPTRVMQRGQPGTLPEIAADMGWQRVVVKPTVASTGWETWLANAPFTAEQEARFERQKQTMNLMVQQFVEGVRDGERSFVFIGGVFSHCVLKQAAGDEFRVHIEWGGTVQRIEPPREQIEWAQSVVAAVKEPWMYARVDAVARSDGLVVMELEMLEPELFFAYDAAAVEAFIRQIV